MAQTLNDAADAALARCREALLDRRVPSGHWEGRLASSALATATAVTALAVARRAGAGVPSADRLIAEGLRWIVAHRSADGGWGDTPDSVSNISTTALAWAALSFGDGEAAVSAARAAERWIERAAGSSRPRDLAGALNRRYGKDRTFSVPILTMCAIAGRLGPSRQAWRLIPQLPFELALLPQRLFGALRLPVVSYALPALIAMGIVRHRLGPGLPGVRGLRARAAPRALDVLRGLQPEGGGFLEAVPLTSFVAMSLVAAGEPRHAVTVNALEFLARTVRPDGSWPVDTNLATWVTTLSVNALAAGGGPAALSGTDRGVLRAWLLGQQWRSVHPYTGAAPGGWAWTDLAGGVPDADDTAGALIALANLGDGAEVRAAAASGVTWLLDLQNGDGGIPTFCRGWGTLPFDRSATDLTAHAIRAWTSWHDRVQPALGSRISRAIERALDFLESAQRGDGAFLPLWFGNQHAPDEQNPVFGTGRTLAGLAAALGAGHARAEAPSRRGAGWLLGAQNDDGGWGAGRGTPSSVEETAAAVSGLAAMHQTCGDTLHPAISRGAAWLVAATAGGTRFPASPFGLYFARLWYAEELYPIIFTAGALEAAASCLPALPTHEHETADSR